MGFLSKYSPQMLSILRIMTGLQLMAHGTNKMFSFPLAANATAHAFNLMSFPAGPAGVIEVVGGILIILGLFSRWAAFIASGECAFAYFIAHFPHSFFPSLNGGDDAVAFCFIFLYIACAGPGPWAINQK